MLKVLGGYDNDGTYRPYSPEKEVVRLGDRLVDSEGYVWAVRDEYHDWVSPAMKDLGFKVNLKVVDTETEDGSMSERKYIPINNREEWLKYTQDHMSNAKETEGVNQTILQDCNNETIAVWQNHGTGCVFEARKVMRTQDGTT